MASGLPQQLIDAINTAAAQYGVDPNYLIRIWQWESGGTFPNPAVNSSNYGGLFGLGQGTTYYGVGPINNLDTSAASIQTQANAAATELAHLTAQHGGSVYAAMLAYSGGSTNEANFVTGGSNPSTYTPGVNSTQTSGGPVVATGGTTATGTPASIPVVSGVWGAIQSILGGGGPVANAIGTAAHAFFTSGAFWDPLLVIVGILLVLIGTIGLVMGHDSAGQTVGVAKRAAMVALA